jgi:uncharacterized membrane protein
MKTGPTKANTRPFRQAGSLLTIVVLFLTGCGQPNQAVYPVIPPEEGEVRVDLSAIGKGSGSFFSYPASSGRNVDYFVYKDSSGTARGVLDACRTCYRWRKGYRLEGDHVVCRKCDMEFTLDGLHEGTGSCVPIGIRSSTDNDTLIIPVTELEAGARYF